MQTIPELKDMSLIALDCHNARVQSEIRRRRSATEVDPTEDILMATATLKHDVYDIEDIYFLDAYMSEKSLFESLKNAVEIKWVMKKGTKFNKIKSYWPSTVYWESENEEITDMSEEWANENLENIVEAPEAPEVSP